MNDKAPISELLQWLAGAPRTYGWSSILAYDRDKANTVLLQEYIERFDSNSYLPPFRELIATTDDTAEYIYDYVFDAARLSFTNATISHSNAMLTQRVIGGSQLTLSKPTGSYVRVEKVYSLDAMDGPLMESEISLQASTGHVNRAGEVILDISTGRNPRLSFARTEHEREKGGQYLLARFAREEEPKRVLVLNQLAVEDDQFLKPGKFEIRTHAAPNSHVVGTPGHGSGAVLAFIAMEDESNGSIPVDDRDMPFLIPDGHSATVLMGQAFLARRIIVQGCRAFAAGSNFTYELFHQDHFVHELRATSGRVSLGPQQKSSELLESVQIADLALPLHNDFASFSVTFRDNQLRVEIEGNAYQLVQVKVRQSGQTINGNVQLFWHARLTYELDADPLAGTLRLKEVGGVATEGRIKPLDFASLPYAALDELAGLIIWMLRDGLDSKLGAFREAVGTIDVFRLNSLLFKGDNAVVLKSVHLPGDVALFGQVAPSLTDFVITPLEPIVGHGQQEAFFIDPPRIGVVWSVEALPGDSGAVGSIDQNGNYTAPDASLIEGVYKRVRVRATLEAHTSTALVTVVVRDISVNPLIQTCGPRNTRAMSAGALSTGTLTWRIADTASGATIAPSTEPDGDHLYTAGPASFTESFVVDEVVVTNEATGNQQSAYVLVVHGMVGLQVLYEADANPDRVQCKALFLNGAPTDGFELEWVLLAGSGSIDGNGLFSVDPAGKHRFAVVGCLMALPGMPFPYIGYCILPIPLIPLPAWLNVMGEAERLLSSPAGERGEK
ncbi:hypothetical protein [Pseudomonas japonica]|uniref:Uncharacterized protein n=1 Tax=Pseudomonas japonica TaxID=256466 RepID=A0A239GUC2_9PSED|nr:hypothetical protein [Pseudomonas japonica]SNS71664.1 hypothetical protein SAMN05444352_113125 [Pseudomonas japonica]